MRSTSDYRRLAKEMGISAWKLYRDDKQAEHLLAKHDGTWKPAARDDLGFIIRREKDPRTGTMHTRLEYPGKRVVQEHIDRRALARDRDDHTATPRKSRRRKK